jgi:nitroreductase
MPARNQHWAQWALVLVLTVTNLYLPGGKPDRFAYYDVGLAVENLVLQAMALGLACHQTEGVDVKKARTEFSIPEGHDPVDIITLGYAGDARRLPEDLRVIEPATRSRKPLRDFVFSDRWGQAAPFVTE